MYIIIYISKIWSINILVRVYRIGMIKYTLNNTKFHMHNIFYSKRGLNYRISKRTTILFVNSYYTVFTMVKIHTPWIHTQIFIDKLLILFVYSNQLFQYDLNSPSNLRNNKISIRLFLRDIRFHLWYISLFRKFHKK